MESAERDKTQLLAELDSLRKSEQRYRACFEQTSEAAMLVNLLTERLVDCNDAFCNLLGFTREEGAKLSLSDIDALETPADIRAHNKEICELGHDIFRTRHRRKNGDTIEVEVHAQVITIEDVPHSLSLLRDVTASTHEQIVRDLENQVLLLAARHSERKAFLDGLVQLLQGFTGCSAVGIRILDGQGNIPYQAYTGFSSEFYELESPLSIRIDACMCVDVMRGEIDPAKPFFTEGGSFFINGTTRFLDTVSEEEKGSSRNECNRAGYESVALVPMKVGGKIYGLIHFADEQENMAPRDTVVAVERVANQINGSVRRIEAEEALAESEKRFHALFENAPLGYQSLDEDGNFIEVNQTWCDTLGYEKNEVLGRNFTEFVVPGQADLFRRNFERFKARDGASNVEYEMVAKCGERRIMSVTGRVAKDPAGAYLQSHCILRDITEQRRAEMALRESEERYHEVIGHMASGVAVYEAINEGRDFVFKDINAAGLVMGKRTREEVIGRSIGEVYPGVRDMRLVDVLRRVYQTGRPEHHPVVSYRDDRVHVWVQNYVFKLPSGEVVAVYDDVSRRKAAEQEREAALAETRRSEKEVSALLGASRAVLDLPTFEEAAREIFNTCRDVIGATSGYVALLSDTGEENEVLFLEAGGRPGAVDPELPMSIRGLRAEAYKTGKAVYDNDFNNSEWMEFMPKGHGTLDNVLFAPLNLDGKTVGIMGIANKPGGFNDDDAALATAFGDFAAIALRKARNEEALRDSEQKYETLVENSPDVIMRFDRQCRCLFASRSSKGFMGKEASELQGLTLAEFGAEPELAAFWERQVQIAFDSNKRLETEFELPVARGVRVIEWRLSPEEGSPGTVQSVLSVARDITEHRRAQHDYQGLFDSMLDGFSVHEIITDDVGKPCDYRFLSVNPAFEKHTGLQSEDVCGRTMLEVFPRTAPEWIETCGRVALEGGSVRSEQYNSHMGKFLDVTVYQGAPKHFACVFADITDRRRAEEELEWELNLHSALAHLSKELINADTGVQCIAEMVLELARGLTRSEHGFVSIIDPLTKNNVIYTTTHMMERPGDAGKAVFRRNEDGTYPGLWGHALNTLEGFYTNAPASECASAGLPKGHAPLESFLAVPVLLRGELAGQISLANRPGGYGPKELEAASQLADIYALAVYRTRTEDAREKLQTQLRRAQKMEAIGTLAGGIAHDFNNILGAIMGFTELAESELPRENPTRELLGEVLAASERAKSLVSQILTFSRQADIERGAVSPELITKEALKFLRSSIPKTISINTKIESGAGYIFADPTQYHQIVVNLCTNAYQAMQETGGTLTVELAAAGADDPGAEGVLDPGTRKYIRLTVSDTGCGMSPDTKERIFDPFFTTKEVGRGTGLGLATVHGIVTSLSGAILVDSELGQGATFRVYLPQVKPMQEIQPPGPSRYPTGNGERILLVDDEKTLVRLMSERLLRLGYAPIDFNDPAEALDAFYGAPHAYDLILSDVSMPGMSGVALAEQARRIRKGIPIILLTGFSESLTPERLQSLGLSAFLMKPVKLAPLAEALHKALHPKGQ